MILNGKLVETEDPTDSSVYLRKKTNAVKSKTVIQKIIADLQDRRGVGDEWDMLDSQTKQEIEKEWLYILLKEFDNA